MPSPLPSGSVANDAIDIESLLPAVDQLFCHRHGKLRRSSFGKLVTIVLPAASVVVVATRVRIRIVHLARIESLVLVQLAAGDRSVRKIPRCPLVGEKIALFIIPCTAAGPAYR